MPTPFYEKYRQLCSELGKSDNAVAAEIGLSNSTVTTWRQGVIPRSPTIKKVANYFGISVEEMMGYSGIKKTPTPEDECLKEKEENEHYGSLNDLYYHGVQSWIEKGLFSVDEKTMLKAHFSGVLSRYKELVERASRVKRPLKIYLKAVEPFNNKMTSPLTTQELAEQFLKQELERDIDGLKYYIDGFAFHFAKTVAEEDLAGQMPSGKAEQESERWEVEEYQRQLLERQTEMEQQKKPTPVAEDELEETFMPYLQALDSDQRRIILDQMDDMVKQKKRYKQTQDMISGKPNSNDNPGIK